MSISDDEWDLIVDRIAKGECTPFLGAGASVASGIPTAEAMATELAREYRYPLADKRDFLRVCQYLSMVRDRRFIASEVALRVRSFIAPGLVHNVLAALPLSTILTTNFDHLMELAFRQARKDPQTIVYRSSADTIRRVGRATVPRPLVYKLHGDVSDPSSMIVTEDDVIEFLSCVIRRDPQLPDDITARFVDDSVLFIGYGLKDWNIRVLMKTLRANSQMKSFAIQKRPNRAAVAKEWEATVMHLRKGDLHCYDMDATDFARELYERFRKQHPDMAQELPP
jgi:hypothetical protein